MRLDNRPGVENYGNAQMMWHIASPASGGTISLGEVWLNPGSEPPLHIHAHEDEAWYILEGTILFQLGMERLVRGSGESIFLPRGIPHGFAVQSRAARILHLYTPGGIEEAFQSLSVEPGETPPPLDQQAVTAAFQARGVTFVGPPLPVILAGESGSADSPARHHPG